MSHRLKKRWDARVLAVRPLLWAAALKVALLLLTRLILILLLVISTLKELKGGALRKGYWSSVMMLWRSDNNNLLNSGISVLLYAKVIKMGGVSKNTALHKIFSTFFFIFLVSLFYQSNLHTASRDLEKCLSRLPPLQRPWNLFFLFIY